MQSLLKITANNNASNPVIQYTWFKNKDYPKGSLYEYTWLDFCSYLKNTIIRAEYKSLLPLLKLATFMDNHRNNVNLDSIYGIEVDYDGEEMHQEKAAELLRKAGIEALIYTSPSHTEEKPRWRVLCPTSKALSPEKRNCLVRTIDHVLGNILAPESFTLSQSYYIGAVEGGQPVQYINVKGHPIDLVNIIMPNVHNEHISSVNSHRSNSGRTAPAYDIALKALISRHPDDFDRNQWLIFSGAFFTSTKGLVGNEVALNDWQNWNSVYYNNNPQDNFSTWKDFGRNGTNGDFLTLAEMSNNDNAKGWAFFGGVVHNIPVTDNPYIAPSGAINRTNDFYFTRADNLKSVKQCWIVKNVIPENSLCLFFGPSGSGKTFGALGLGLSIASGSSWYGNEVQKGEVIYVCGEGKHGINKRIKAWGTHFQTSLEEVPFFVSSGAADFSDTSSILKVKHAIDSMGIKPSLIIIDTLSRNTSGDENDSQQMAAFIKALDNLKNKYNASVLLVHHTGHSDKDRARGSSVLKAAMDSEFRFEKSGTQIKFRCTKMKDSDEPSAMMFELKQIPVKIGEFPEMGAVLDFG